MSKTHLNSTKPVFDFLALASSHLLAMFVSVGLSLATTRLLVPADYGVVASMLFVFSVLSFVFDWGFEQALLAWPAKTFERACQTHMAIRLASGLAGPLCIGLLVLSGRLTDSAKFWVAAALAASFFCEKIGLTYKTLLEKQGRLKRLAFFEFLSSMSGSTTAFVMALKGFGAVSLACQLLVQRGLLALGYMLASPQFVWPRFELRVARSFFATFGPASALSASFGLAVYDFMPFLIERLCSAQQAGLYARAFSIATLPLMGAAVFGRIASSAYSRNQFDAGQLSHWFCSLQVAKGVLVVVPQILLAATAHWWTGWLFASRWHGLVPVYIVLTLYGLARSFYDDVTAIISVGYKNPWHFTFAQGLHAALILAVGPLMAWRFGAIGGAVVMAGSMLVVTIQFWSVIFDYLGLEMRTFLSSGLRTLYSGAIKVVGNFKKKGVGP